MDEFRPPWKPVEDKDLAQRMANAGLQERKEAEASFETATHHKGTLREILKGGSSPEAREFNVDINEYIGRQNLRRVDLAEDLEEIQYFVEKEVRKLSKEELQQLITRAKQESIQLDGELESYLKIFRETKGPTADAAILKRSDEMDILEKKAKKAHALLEALEVEEGRVSKL